MGGFVRLGSVCFFDLHSLSDKTDKDYEFEYISLSDVEKGVLLNTKRCQFAKAPSRARRKVRKGDVLLATVRPNLQAFYLFKEEIHDTIVSTGFCVLTPQSELLAEYLHQYLFSEQMLKVFYQFNVGTNYPAINSSDIKNFPIFLPPLSEQKAIADILQTWDTAINKTEDLIAAKERRFAWFRQNVLTGLIRIKNYSSPWKYQLFQDVLTEHKLASTGKENVHSVSVHKGVINQIKHLGRSFSAKNTLHYNLVKPGDIIYTKSPTGDFPYGIIKQSKLQENVIVSPLYGVFSPRTYELGTILDAYFESSTYTSNYLRPVIQKGAKNTISCKNTSFLSRGLLLPTEVEEEHSIAEHINTAKREIDTLKTLADRYRTQKRGLMQKLLTGTWKVKV